MCFLRHQRSQCQVLLILTSWKSRTGSFLRHFISLLSLRSVAEIPFSSETRFLFPFASRIKSSTNLWYSILSQSYCAVSFSDTPSIQQLFSFVRFLHKRCSLLGLLPLDRTWLNTKTAYVPVDITSARPPVLYTACCVFVYLCICIPAGLLSSQPTSLHYR